jgi:glycosyltransferase involved in cell wall biosynthesis
MGAPLSAPQRAQAQALENVEVYESQYKLEWMQDPWDDVRAAGEWLLDLERQVEPDLVHLNDYAGGALPFRSPVMVVGHSCVLSWWQAVKGDAAPPEWIQYRETISAGLHGADLVVAPSRAMLSALLRHYGPFENVRVIYNGRDARSGPPTLKEPFILSAGRLWDEAKNVMALDAIASDVAWSIRVAGDARHPDGGAVRTNHLTVLGRLESSAMADQYARASIYALPARYEPFGLSVLEAAHAGCALVLGDIDSLREIWGDAAIYVRPDDTDALRSNLQRLIEQPGERAVFADRARMRAAQYSAAEMADAYAATYGCLMGNTPGHVADEAVANVSVT